MSILHTLPALGRSACTLLTTSSLLLLTACSSLDLPFAKRDAAGTLADAPTASGPAPEPRSARLALANVPKDNVPLAVEGARAPNAPSVITRSLSLDALRGGNTAAPAANDEDEAKDAAGPPTDPLRPEATLNLDDREAAKDLWGRVRQGFTLPPLESELVADHERWYASRPDYVQRMTDRANRYLFHVVEEVERRGMPSELALLPFIESAFNPQALSPARASGIWQFMPATGKDFELKQNLFRDDRRDVLASTRAAMDYLQRLYRMFGDWHLALAAYNWGEGNVQRAIARNTKAGLPTDYLSLNMPAETRNYVPKLHAVRNIVANPEGYGLALSPIENHPYFVSVPIQRDMDVALAARLAQLTQADFQALNPSMNKPVILAAGTPQILLPYANASSFMHNLSRHKGTLASWTAWVVPKTMRPSDAAKRLGMSESDLREINRIPPRMLVKAGSTLLVPRSQHREQDVSETVADNAMMSLAPDLPPMRRMTVKARKRDTVASIARRYKVSEAQVAQWNKVRVGATFKRAQAVVVYVPVKAARAVASRDDDDRPKARSRSTSSAKASAKNTRASTKVATTKPAGKAKAKARQVASSRNQGKTKATAPSRQQPRARVVAANSN
ncbi:MAG: transglycosylase SLT domain-containing protein [Aquabacterium sp.]|jgi:membrane-bound lytic murein transglycosylase D|uniref:transglycosylase SLT domain-containing protein n=1 Tax=Aquabacterium sp. TaxID=1872578 RepID=UPI003BB175E6